MYRSSSGHNIDISKEKSFLLKSNEIQLEGERGHFSPLPRLPARLGKNAAATKDKDYVGKASSEKE